MCCLLVVGLQSSAVLSTVLPMTSGGELDDGELLHGRSKSLRSSRLSLITAVFDLPQIYTKPSAQALLDTLSSLAIDLPSWDGSDSRGKDDKTCGSGGHARRRVSPEGLTGYLTRIVASDLRWIEDDAEREEVWEQASLRLSERSGRTAMPAKSRTFRIPSTPEPINITIHEPALTADNLGLKTWASSYVLAKRLHTLRIPTLPASQRHAILELGAGTGLVGIAAAAVLGATVCLTDLPEIEPNLAANVAANRAVVEQNGGYAYTSVLDWSELDGNPTPPSESMVGHAMEDDKRATLPTLAFPVIVAADPLYSPEHPRLLVQTIGRWLLRDPSARVVIELPLREAYSPEVADFKGRMHCVGLDALEQGEEVGYDDWGSGSAGGLQEVRCWWSVWGWR